MIYDRNISEVYDKMHLGKDYDKEALFLASMMGTKTSRILDVGCGTGMHAYKLATMGYEVLGLDPSRDMIDIANMRTGKELSLSFQVGYVSDHNPGILFDSAISMFNIPNHILSIRELREYFSGISRNLKTGGLFVFDCFNQVAMARDEPVLRVSGDRRIVPHFDVFTGKFYIQYEGDVGHVLRHRIWSPDVLIEIMGSCGLEVLDRYRPFTRAPATKDDYKIMFMARRSP